MSDKVHKVLPGESIWEIAQKELGDGKRWLELVKLNPGIIVLVHGEALKLPEVEKEQHGGVHSTT